MDTTAGSLTAGNGALADHRWKEALEHLQQADSAAALGGHDLESWAAAAWFNANADLGIEVKERAFRAHVEEGSPERAAIVAFDLGREYAFKRQFSIASAWVARGSRQLEGREESAAHGYEALTSIDGRLAAGDAAGAIAEATRAAALGLRHGDLDLNALGLVARGRTLITQGGMEEGFASLEEATIAASSGELSPMITGFVFCSMIAACRDTTDYRRATEWTDAARRWCEKQSINGFPGVCRVHRAELMALQGSLLQAEVELTTATKEIAAYNATPPLADGMYALGEIKFRLGDLAGAEEALRQAHALGRSPQPALALLRLAEGKVKAAASAIDAAVVEEGGDMWRMARLLPAQVEIAVANGDAVTARKAVEALRQISEGYRSSVLHATAHDALARVLLAEGSPEEAAREVRSAIVHWHEVHAPYEVARDRMVLSRALRALGQSESALLELEAACSEFERLGAKLDVAAAAAAVEVELKRRAAPATTTKTFFFTDIVGSTNLAEAVGNGPWELLLRWHDDTLHGLFNRYGGQIAHSTGDGFFVAFDNPSRAIECGLAIQEALAEHRQTNGFAPTIRIGVHAAEASQRGDDFSGVGVHVAARVAAHAVGGEVLVSAETAALAEGSWAVGNRRAVSLKGVSAPVEVVTVTAVGVGGA